MLTLLLIEIGIVIAVAIVVGADMAENGHPYLGD